MLELFLWRFPRIPEETWRQRFARGQVWSAAGSLSGSELFQPLLEVHYRREVDQEPPVRTDIRMIWSDPDLLVVDKPPFLPVTPGGRWVRGCLLHLLGDDLGEHDLAPLHRLDRLTSGLVVLSRRPATRSQVSRLFQLGAPVSKRYTAVCETQHGDPPEHLELEHHITRSSQHYWRQTAVKDRPPNSRCELELLEHRDSLALYSIRPVTGRKHQLRVQLATAGLPVLGDPMYGTRKHHDPHDLSQRMWLDASQLTVSEFRLPSGKVLSTTWSSGREPLKLLRQALAAAARSDP